MANVARINQFDEIIDVRTPAEFAEDHIPGAINCAVLSDEERARVGTIYKQVSPFEAKKIGAALISQNIAQHLQQRFLDRPKSWRPLVYCWRGGKRSGAMTHILQQVGWRAEQLEGGYKSYRHAVREKLEALPQAYTWRVVCGLTGSGKSRLLLALQQAGAQTLDLEGIACHRGSVLGNFPDIAQPSQKMFDSLLLAALQQLDPARPVYIEAESKKIGDLRVPQNLIEKMWQSDCVLLETDTRGRVKLLLEEYAHYLHSPPQLHAKLDCLLALHGREKIQEWKSLADQGQWPHLVEQLLTQHYDPAYTRSTLKHYVRYAQGLVLRAERLDEQSLSELVGLRSED